MFTTATPPSMSSSHSKPSSVSWPPMPPRRASFNRYAIRDFPASRTSPSDKRAGATDMSRSSALLEDRSDGAKYWTRRNDGDSSSTESLSS